MNVKDKAKAFAIKAHANQIRKSEPDKPMIVHPLTVGKILESFGYDDNVIAAGYLHDVVEDTKFEIKDIKENFNDDIANLVMTASEPDKSLPWVERKKYTIENTRKLPLRNKLIICADKIDNLEDLFLKFQKSGIRDFSAFNKSEEYQKWYYTSVYESLIEGEDKELPIFIRLKDILDKVFYEKEDLFLKNTIFSDNQDYYQTLQKLHAQKVELKKLKSLTSLSKPFVIEFSGTPRTGKTTTINNLYDFFKKGGFNVKLIEEFISSKYYKETFKKREFKNLGDLNIAILEESYKQLKEEISKDNDIILIDRSLNDRQIWNYRRFQYNEIEEDVYKEVTAKYSKISRELIDFLVITYADPLISLKRDYLSSLALEKRNFLNENNITEFNEGIEALKELFEESVESLIMIDTSDINPNETAIKVAEEIMPIMRKEYIKSLKKEINK